MSPLNLSPLKGTKIPLNEFRKAAIFIAAFSFWFGQGSSLALVTTKSEGYKEIISKAQNLVLQKERSQALDLLYYALKQENPKGPAYKEIKKNMSSISRVFIFEKAQQAYELAISMRKQDLTQSYKTLKDGLSHEKDNLNLLLALSRLEVSKNECAVGKETFQKIPKPLSTDEEVQLLEAQLLFCGKENLEPSSISVADQRIIEMQNFQLSNSSLGLYWSLLELRKFEIQKNEQKIKEKLKTLDSLAARQHPDLLYWQWKISKKTDPYRNQLGHKYILSCQSLSQRQSREYLIDPFLCQRVAEVEREMKKQGALIEK
jgi:hypothetical protein